MKRQIRCFVASAFGRDDVDAIFDHVIKPLLRKGLHIIPLRVDRVEHNDDIDDKIFELLDQADFCIADLTYARPSVYYEAGYAFGKGKPVIYIARKDHLKAVDSDPHGLFRIHFDLQMKNVIPWSEPNEGFKKRLAARIRVVTRPLGEAPKRVTTDDEARSRFLAMSPKERISELTRTAHQLILSQGYEIRSAGQSVDFQGARVSAVRTQNGKQHRLTFNAMVRLGKAIFSDVEASVQWVNASSSKLKTASIVLASLDRAPSGSASHLLSFRQLRDGRFVTHHEGAKIQVFVLDGIRSTSDLVDRLTEVLRVLAGDANRRALGD
jgi:nucleoside 2-deoxyribosyltransferase